MTSQDTIKLIETKIQKLPLVDSEVIDIITLLNNPASNFEQIVQKIITELGNPVLKHCQLSLLWGTGGSIHQLCGTAPRLRQNEGHSNHFHIDGPFYQSPERFRF